MAHRRTRLTAPERRLAILDAAIDVIPELGVHAFRVRDVADAAHVSQPLVSFHFGSREEIVLDAFNHADERAVAFLEKRAGAAPTGALAVLSFAHESFSDEREVARCMRLWHAVWAYANFSSDLRDALRDRRRAWVDLIAEFVDAGYKDGTIKYCGDAQAAALFLVTIMDGLEPLRRYQLADYDAWNGLLARALETIGVDVSADVLPPPSHGNGVGPAAPAQ